MNSFVAAALREAAISLQQLQANENALKHIAVAGEMLVSCFQGKGRVFSCGNGGSMCDAMHFAEELSGRFRKDRPPLSAIALSDPAHLTCAANDFGYDSVFARAVMAHGRPGDILLAISTSGTSKNIAAAVQAAHDANMRVITLTGRPASMIGNSADIDICTPGGQFSDRVQELHIKVIHILIELVERQLFPENYRG